jgi:serine/threonine-protein kinase
VQYAHQHLVVHRDLKPSNMLVTADGQLKLLDFGIAKLLDPLRSSGDGDVASTTGRAMTPEYAAPEQVRGLGVSTATDVYSLGVLLYVLLTGQRPYDLRDQTHAEMERTICEVEPPKPSAIVVRDDDRRADRARARGTSPDRLGRALRGDLDVIVMQALRKEPARRYASPAALRDDLVRFRDGLPIHARADSSRYRLGKFVRRRAVPLAIAATGVVALTAAALRERALRSRAEEETRKAEQTTDFMFSLFEASENGQTLSDTISARQLLSRGIAQARTANAQPALRAQMLDVLGRLELDIGNYVDARPLLTEALEPRKQLYGEDHLDVATSLGHLADAVGSTGDEKSAVEMRREELAIRRRINGNDDVKTTDALFALAMELHAAGNGREAGPLTAEWKSRVSKAPPEITRTRLQQLSSLTEAVLFAGQPQVAESLGRAQLTLARQLYGEHNDQIAVAMGNIGVALDRQGRFAEAEPILHQVADAMVAAYPAGNPRVAAALKVWAVELGHLSRYAEAEAPFRKALEIARRSVGDGSAEVVGIEQELSVVLATQGQYDEALSLSRHALGVALKQFGASSIMGVHAQVFVADALRGQGRFSEAEPMLLAAEARFRTGKSEIVKGYWRGAVGALSRLYDAEGQQEKAAHYRALISP